MDWNWPDKKVTQTKSDWLVESFKMGLWARRSFLVQGINYLELQK